MTVKIYLVREFLGNQIKFATEHEYIDKYCGKSGWVGNEIELDIPERFHPHEHEGRVIVTVGGKTGGLRQFLSVGRNGDPVIRWKDEQLGCERSVSLKRVEEVNRYE